MTRRAAGVADKEGQKKKYLVRMLAAYMDLGGRIQMQGESIDLDAKLKGLRLETLIELDQRSTQARGFEGKVSSKACLSVRERTSPLKDGSNL